MTDFRQLQRIQFASDVEIDEQAHALHDRIAAIHKAKNQGLGSPKPETLGYTKAKWARVSRVRKEIIENRYWRSLTEQALYK